MIIECIQRFVFFFLLFQNEMTFLWLSSIIAWNQNCRPKNFLIVIDDQITTFIIDIIHSFQLGVKSDSFILLIEFERNE